MNLFRHSRISSVIICVTIVENTVVIAEHRSVQSPVSPDSPDLSFSLEEDFVSWREQFWPAVCEHFGVEALGDDSRYIYTFILLYHLNEGKPLPFVRQIQRVIISLVVLWDAATF